MKTNKLSLTSLQEYLQVDPTSPSGLRWKKQPSNNSPAGKHAGTQNKEGYWRVALKRQLFLAHRAVLLLSGVFPEKEDMLVDHINQNPSDNRLENLRWVTNATNQRNQPKRTKLSPYKHTYPKPNGTWQFQCKQKELGIFCQFTANTAAEAYYGGLARRLEMSWI